LVLRRPLGRGVWSSSRHAGFDMGSRSSTSCGRQGADEAGVSIGRLAE
jgi:hypothetical protein